MKSKELITKLLDLEVYDEISYYDSEGEYDSVDIKLYRSQNLEIILKKMEEKVNYIPFNKPNAKY